MARAGAEITMSEAVVTAVGRMEHLTFAGMYAP